MPPLAGGVAVAVLVWVLVLVVLVILVRVVLVVWAWVWVVVWARLQQHAVQIRQRQLLLLLRTLKHAGQETPWLVQGMRIYGLCVQLVCALLVVCGWLCVRLVCVWLVVCGLRVWLVHVSRPGWLLRQGVVRRGL